MRATGWFGCLSPVPQDGSSIDTRLAVLMKEAVAQAEPVYAL
jgi:hypothetical protein